MIAASEPLEFVPHGRTVLGRHPGPIHGPATASPASETSLLHKLTNFAIRDESLADDKEHETWLIREVFYRDSEERPEEDERPVAEDSKEHLRVSSRLRHDFNVSVRSELAFSTRRMDTDSVTCRDGPSKSTSANSSDSAFNKPSLDSSRLPLAQTGCSARPLNAKTDSCYEEELYVKGHTAVWSKGLVSSPATRASGPERRETVACFTCDAPIRHALFCHFRESVDNGMLLDALNSQPEAPRLPVRHTAERAPAPPLPAVLLVDDAGVRAFAADGREYVASVPFRVRRAWPMRHGVLLEKDAAPLVHGALLPDSFLRRDDTSDGTFFASRLRASASASASLSRSAFEREAPLPVCFSLSHPLDEVVPVLMKSPARGLHYYNDADLEILFVSSEPSLVLALERRPGAGAAHSLWRLRRSTRDECLAACPDADASGTLLSQSADLRAGRRSAQHAPSKRVSGTPSPARSRADSPMASAFRRQGLSPHASIGQASSASMATDAPPRSPPTLPLYPHVCLEHVWTEQPQPACEAPAAARDCFLHTDIVGHEYLCYTTRSGGASRLQTLRLHSGGAAGVIVGAAASVAARRALPLPHLGMIALLDDAGNIMLQSGLSAVGKVHVGGVLARLIDSPYSKRGGLASPFPRRSSLLPSAARATDAPPLDDSALHLLSPVPHAAATRHADDKHALGLHGLRDAAGARLTLQFDRGLLYRIALPDWSGCALVERCLRALRCVLPKELAMQLMVRWYGVRNAPGTRDSSPRQEWAMFGDLLCSWLGYGAHSGEPAADRAHRATKKQRTSGDGTDDDWHYLMRCSLHAALAPSLAERMRLADAAAPPAAAAAPADQEAGHPDGAAPLSAHCAQILHAFHLVYEDAKLSTLLAEELRPLARLLHRLARDRALPLYASHYWTDFPDELQRGRAEGAEAASPGLGPADGRPPSVFRRLSDAVGRAEERDADAYPHLPGVNDLSGHIVEAVWCAMRGVPGGVRRVGGGTPRPRPPHRAPGPYDADAAASATVLLLCERGITSREIDALPSAVALLLAKVFERCRASPPAHWPAPAYRLLRREDLVRCTLAAHSHADDPADPDKETAYSECEAPSPPASGLAPPAAPDDADRDHATGMEHLDTRVLRLLYPHDQRRSEALRLLQSALPASLELAQRPEVSDHEFIEEQEKHLFALSSRTTALPVARGMLTLRTAPQTGTEGARVPRLCLSGRGPPPRCNAVDLMGDVVHAPWPMFHNGVAAGLALVPAPGARAPLRASWVLYNRPKGQGSGAAAGDLSVEHAGFLMALGLNGHLRDMPFMNVYEYLVKCHELTSVGLLLGLAATHRGSMDAQATKMMSIHLEPLLPPTAVELDIQHSILVAALMGVGLLYQGTAHAHYAHVLLHEIGRPPGPEMDNCVEREGYALAAGLALGMVMVGAHAHAPPQLARTLRHYMLGGSRRPQHAAHKDKYRAGSWAVREGDAVNVDVTAPGATLALGLLHMGSGDRAVAEWLAPPATARLLHAVRPDLLMLRVIARGLVLWESVEPCADWVEAQVPDFVREHRFVKPTERLVDYEAVNQAYCNIVAGACFCLGLRYAGSGCEDARDALLHYARLFVQLGGKSVAELAGRATLDTCLCAVLLAAAMVMAGRGDVHVLRLVRRLRVRLPPAAQHAQPPQPPLTHGGHMAVHCALGLLFLGGGRCTLATSRPAVAALLAAFFPKFPTHHEDNRYHLQAFRHLYVLATEPRLLLLRELRTGRLCTARLQLVTLDGSTLTADAPRLLPELRHLREVRVADSRYWPLVFTRDTNWHLLQAFLEHSRCIDVERRAGCLSHAEDPQGFLTLLAQTLTVEGEDVWAAAASDLHLFGGDPAVCAFTRLYLRSVGARPPPCRSPAPPLCADCLPLPLPQRRKRARREARAPRPCQCRRDSPEERRLVEWLGALAYHCVVKDTLFALPAWISLLTTLGRLERQPSAQHVWQLKLLLAQLQRRSAAAAHSNELLLSIAQTVRRLLDEWEAALAPLLDDYLGGAPALTGDAPHALQPRLSAYVLFYDLPRGALRSGPAHPLAVLMDDQAPAMLASLLIAPPPVPNK